MRRFERNSCKALFLLCLAMLWLCLLSFQAAADPTDRIHDFTITVDVNEDASLNMTYHIEWEVLDESIMKASPL